MLGMVLSIVLGVIVRVKARNAPAEFGGGPQGCLTVRVGTPQGMATTGIVFSALALLLQITAVNSLRRSERVANEMAVIGDIRSVRSAEQAYAASANAGYYDTLECLVATSKCIAGYTGPKFAEAVLALSERGGYRRTFYPGPKAAKDKTSKSESSITSYAYTAVPIIAGKTGWRSFCGDPGRISFTDGSEPRVAGGRCADPCQDLK
jgi:hypothetical protein